MIKKSLIIISLLLLAALTSYTTYSFFSYQTIDLETINQLGEWKSAESELKIYKGENEYSIYELISDENKTNTIHTFTPQQNQYFSFEYKIETEETALGFDTPNFVVKINGEVALQRTQNDNQWHREFIDLSKFVAEEVIIELLPNNTVDDVFLPQLEVREVSTAKYYAKQNDRLTFETSKENVSIYIKYQTEVQGSIVNNEVEISDPLEFNIADHFYGNELEYYSVDFFGNVEESIFVSIYTDFSAPEAIEGVSIYNEVDGKISLVFLSPGDNYPDSTREYDLRISDSMEQLNNSWFDTEKLTLNNHKKFGYANLPQSSGDLENILTSTEQVGDLFFAIKSIDQAGNYSDISYISELNL